MLVVAACSRRVVFSKGIPGRGMCGWLLGWTVAGCSQGVFFKIVPLSGHVLSATPPVSFVFACLIWLVPPTGGHRQDLAAVAAGRRWLLERRACTGRRGISKRGSKQYSRFSTPPPPRAIRRPYDSAETLVRVAPQGSGGASDKVVMAPAEGPTFQSAEFLEGRGV